MTKELILTQGFVALVDDDDYERTWRHRWSMLGNKKFYYARNSKLGALHRFIMNCPKDMMVDHINHNGLDNRKENLRICTAGQNRMNSRAAKNKSIQYKGVARNSDGGKFYARITANHRNLYLGSFDTAEEAARAYDDKAIEIFGEFAKLNFSK